MAATFQIDGPSLEPPRTVEGAVHVTAGRAAVAMLGLAVCLGWAAVAGWGRAGLVALLLVVSLVGPVLVYPGAVGLTQRVLVGSEVVAMVLLARAWPGTCRARAAEEA